MSLSLFVWEFTEIYPLFVWERDFKGPSKYSVVVKIWEFLTPFPHLLSPLLMVYALKETPYLVYQRTFLSRENFTKILSLGQKSSTYVNNISLCFFWYFSDTKSLGHEWNIGYITSGDASGVFWKFYNELIETCTSCFVVKGQLKIYEYEAKLRYDESKPLIKHIYTFFMRIIELFLKYS